MKCICLRDNWTRASEALKSYNKGCFKSFTGLGLHSERRGQNTCSIF